VASLLIEKGADVNAAPLGYTALHAAVLRGTLADRRATNPDPKAGAALVHDLLAHGANPDAQVMRGTPVRRWSHDFAFMAVWVGATPFWLAAKFLEIDMMKALAQGGADPNVAASDGSTPLSVAAGSGYSRFSGTVAFIKDRRDFSYYNSEPDEIAARIPPEEERAALEAVRYILSLGADVRAVDSNGNTALHAAASLGMDTVIQSLVDSGADINAKNKSGRTPLAMARRDTDTLGFAGDTSRSIERGSTAALLRKLGAIP
jgi:ankyrin repeat protein